MRLWQFFVRKYSRTSPLKCAHILRRQYTVVQPGWQPSNRRQNFRLPADVKRANRVYFNTNIVNFIRIDIALFKYNALYFTYPPPKHEFSHILPSCSRFTAESQQVHPSVVLLHNNPWLRNISTKFPRLLKQRSVLYFRFCLLR